MLRNSCTDPYLLFTGSRGWNGRPAAGRHGRAVAVGERGARGGAAGRARQAAGARAAAGHRALGRGGEISGKSQGKAIRNGKTDKSPGNNDMHFVQLIMHGKS